MNKKADSWDTFEKAYGGFLKKVRSFLSKKESKLFLEALLFRLGMLLILIVIMALSGRYGEHGLHVNDVFDSLKRTDAQHYINIAKYGYAANVEDGHVYLIVFFPLYPWLIRLLTLITRNYEVSALIISYLCFSGAIVYLYKLLRIDYNKKTTYNAIYALCFFPFAFFFGGIMTESLFLFIVCSFLYYLRKHKYLPVTILGFLAGMTKVQGNFLALCIIAELCTSERLFKKIKTGEWPQALKKIFFTGIKCVPMVGGTVVYLIVNYMVEGDPFRFLTYQREHWGNYLAPPWNTFDYLKGYSSTWFSGWGMAMFLPEFLLMIITLAFLILAFKYKLHPTYLVYFVVFYLITYSSSWLISGGRYTSNIIPLFVTIGVFLSKHKKVRNPYLVFSLIFMICYMTASYYGASIY